MIISEQEMNNKELQNKLADYEFLLLKSTEELRKQQEEMESFRKFHNTSLSERNTSSEQHQSSFNLNRHI